MTASIEKLKPERASNETTHGGASGVEQHRATRRLWFGLFQNLWVLGLIAFALGVALTLMHRPWSQPEGGDEAIWDYVAQCIVRGQIPYREVVEIKTPLSAYLSAAAMAAGKSVGLRDVIAVRMLNVLMFGTLSAITSLVGVVYLRSRVAAAIAFLIPLVPSHFAEWMVTGTEPKLPMILCGMISLLLVAKRSPFWAGFFSMLSFLCWQPGLMFTAAALLMFSRYLTSWCDVAAVKVVLGALVPLAAMLSYFYSIGALAELWTWTVTYNFSIYAPETMKVPSEMLAVLWKVLVRVFGAGLVFVGLGVAGLVALVVERVKANFKGNTQLDPRDVLKDAITIPPLIYLAFCFINFQSGPDLIPLFPFIGLFAGWLIVNLARARLGHGRLRLLPVLTLIAVLVLIFLRAVTYKVDSGLTLQNQDREFATIADALGPNDRIYVHGTVEILVLLNRPNLNPYLFLDRRKDDWIAKRTTGGFQAVIAEMESLAPEIVAVSRLGKVAHRAELEQWVKQHYEKLDLRADGGVYVRK